MTIRIAHLSDLHFGGELPDAVEAALAAVAAFAPDLVAVTGDLTLNGQPAEFRAAAAWLSRLPSPRLVTPGNHDTPYWNLVLRALIPFERYSRYIGAPGGGDIDGPGWRARSRNSARGAQPRLDWSKGALSLGTLRRMDWGADEPSPPLKLFACHHPLIDLDGAPVTGGVHDGPKAAAILEAAGVELVLTGHVHRPFALPLPYGAMGCYAIGAGTLSRRLRGAPAGFTTIIADESRFTVTAMGWTDEAFTPCATWDLPRRRARSEVAGLQAETTTPIG